MGKIEKATAVATREVVEALPDYLKPAGGVAVGVESKGESKITPRLKVLQAQTDRELVDEFGVGAVLISDTQSLVCDPDGSFIAVPIYWFPSWDVWKDVNDKSAEMPIEATSLDPNSEIAAKAKARHSERYGPKDGFTRSWIESMNLIVEIQTGPSAGAVALASWSKGSAKFGRRLMSFLGRTGADIFAHQIEFFSDETENAKGHWHVLNHRPAKKLWVSAADHARLRTVYDGLHRSYTAGAVNTDTGEISGE